MEPSRNPLSGGKDRSGARRVSLVNLTLAAVVWVGLLVAVGAPTMLSTVRDNWRIALAMVFGSLIGGGTSEGGGAVAFPVMTKVLQIPAPEARLFTFAIQSIGMTAASISILLNRVPVERRVLVFGAPPAILGAVLSTIGLAGRLEPHQIRVFFTALLTALAIALVVQVRTRTLAIWSTMPRWSRRERLIVIGTGLVGGLLSGAVGVGENTVVFIVLVLLFRVSEKISTPTTVILMAMVSVAAFATHVLVLDDFHGEVTQYWMAAAPIVAIGAPLGSRICYRMSAAAIRGVLVFLISIEFVSTILIVRFTPQLAVFSASSLLLLTLACIWLTRRRTYLEAETGASSAVTTPAPSPGPAAVAP